MTNKTTCRDDPVAVPKMSATWVKAISPPGNGITPKLSAQGNR